MNRRTFIQQTSALMMTAEELFAAKKHLKKYGCQLYSIRDKMPKDAKGSMEKLAAMGYKQFESYSKDPFWGMKPAECQAFLEKMSVKMISTHAGMGDITEDFVKKAVDGGLLYIICPFIGPQKDLDGWKRRAAEFNVKGELCKKYGLQFGYHNHSYSFAFVNGLKGQKVLLDNTDPALVCFEIDMCWSEAAGENTIQHLQEYGKRYELCHVKQIQQRDAQRPNQTDLQDGIINYSTLLGAAKKSGMKYYIVEQEDYPSDSMASMLRNASFMKDLKI